MQWKSQPTPLLPCRLKVLASASSQPSPVFQFGMSSDAAVVQLLSKHSEQFDEFLKLLKAQFDLQKAQSEQLARVLTVLEGSGRALSQIEVTSQVCVTRSNMEEWRSCISTVSRWHGCSMQQAY